MRIKQVLIGLPLLVGSVLIAGCSVEKSRCESSEECRIQRVCFQGECRFPDAVDATIPRQDSNTEVANQQASGSANAEQSQTSGSSGGSGTAGQGEKGESTASSQAPEQGLECSEVCNHVAEVCREQQLPGFDMEESCRRRCEEASTESRRCLAEIQDCSIQRITECISIGR